MACVYNPSAHFVARIFEAKSPCVLSGENNTNFVLRLTALRKQNCSTVESWWQTVAPGGSYNIYGIAKVLLSEDPGQP